MSDKDLNYDNVSETFASTSIDEVKLSSPQKQLERTELSQQIDEFLATGGEINYVDAQVLADPPKKPISNYGSQPI